MKKNRKKLILLSALSLMTPFAKCEEKQQVSASLSTNELVKNENDSLSDGNYISSKHSLQLALSMLLPGASDQAKKEIMNCYGYESEEDAYQWAKDCMTKEEKLGFSKEIEEITWEAIKKPPLSEKEKSKMSMYEKFKWNLDPYEYKAKKTKKKIDPAEINNSIWIKSPYKFNLFGLGLKFNNKFKEISKSIFHATAESFKEGEASRKINSWISSKTKGKINDLVPPGANPDCAIVNTIYFKSDFKDPFKEKDSKEEEFLNNDGSKSKTRFMNKNKDYSHDYYENENFKSVRLDYVNGCHMYLFVPQENKSLKDITTKDLKNIGSLMEKYDPKNELSEFDKKNTIIHVNVDIKIPKFKDTFEKELNDFCKNILGIKEIFDRNKNPLPNVCNIPIFVTQILQKALVELTEKGTEAAVATEILCERCGCAPNRKKEIYIYKNFHANKNFKYIITSPDGTVLFEGQRVKF